MQTKGINTTIDVQQYSVFECVDLKEWSSPPIDAYANHLCRTLQADVRVDATTMGSNNNRETPHCGSLARIHSND